MNWLIQVAQAAESPGAATAVKFVNKFNDIILFPTIALLSAVAVLVFTYGAFIYVVNAGNEQARQTGVKHITWGIVGLVVMLSAYTILQIFVASFGLEDILDDARDGTLTVPDTPSGGDKIGGDGGEKVGGGGADKIGGG